MTLRFTRTIFALTLLVLSHSACSLPDANRKEVGYELLGDQVAEGALNVRIDEVFSLGTVEIGKLADAAGRGDAMQMQQLIAQGVPINGVGQRAMTPLLWALGKRNMAGFLWLLEHGADPNLVSCCDTKRPKLSPMALAAQGSDPRFLDVLLNHGGDPNLVADDAQRTPIFYAVTLRRMRNIELLIQHKADPNHVDLARYDIGAGGDTPLGQAMNSGQFEIGLMLLHAGADPCVKDRAGHSVLGSMVGRGNSGATSKDREAFPQIVEYLKLYTCS